jgi:carbamate kinase
MVIALGHRALGTNLPEQKEAVGRTAQVLADFIQDGWQMCITHSNAPQVGMIHTAMNEFGREHDGYTSAPMSVCSAMSQGYIGYDLQNGIRSALIRRGIYKPVSTVLTQVTVDPYDEAFYTPIKKIGRLMGKEEALAEEARGNDVVEVTDHASGPGGAVSGDLAMPGAPGHVPAPRRDGSAVGGTLQPGGAVSGTGGTPAPGGAVSGAGGANAPRTKLFSRVVASPAPVAIIEIDAIKALLDADQIVIGAGGGGIPVMEQGYVLKGAGAIVEKDMAAGLLAREVDADVLLILTAVDHASLRFGTPDETPIRRMTPQEAETYIEEGHFAPATMQPKIRASIDFIRSGKGRSAIITSAEKARDALRGGAGTLICE